MTICKGSIKKNNCCMFLNFESAFYEVDSGKFQYTCYYFDNIIAPEEN